MTVKKGVVKKEVKMVVKEPEPKPIPVEVWNKIFQTYAEDHRGDTNLVELQQNPATKDVRAVKIVR